MDYYCTLQLLCLEENPSLLSSKPLIPSTFKVRHEQSHRVGMSMFISNLGITLRFNHGDKCGFVFEIENRRYCTFKPLLTQIIVTFLSAM